jgi:hypothetical protein
VRPPFFTSIAEKTTQKNITIKLISISQFRPLAAFMFTNLIGYTALMGNDDQLAFSLPSKNCAVKCQ